MANPAPVGFRFWFIPDLIKKKRPDDPVRLYMEDKNAQTGTSTTVWAQARLKRVGSYKSKGFGYRGAECCDGTPARPAPDTEGP